MNELIQRIDEALQRLAEGRLIMIRDDEGRENEGDLVGAAAHATAEMVNFMVRFGRGLVCQPITEETARRLQLAPQAARNTDSHGTAFTVSVDAAENTSTGISAEDRAVTARRLADPDSRAEDFRRPGHMFPLVAREGGVFRRFGHTEASLDMVRLAGLPRSALICEVLSEDGTMARGAELERLAREWDMPLISVADIREYRRRIGDFAVKSSSSAQLPTEFGNFRISVFHTDDPAGAEAVLLESEKVPEEHPIVRIHSECLTGEAFHSHRCDCGPQLEEALRTVDSLGGAVVYLRQEGRGIGLFEKIRAYTLQDEGRDTLEANIELGHRADERDYSVAAAILKHRGYDRVKLLTNNPDKIQGLEAAGITVTERMPIHVGHSRWNRDYLTTKFIRMGHMAPSEEQHDSIYSHTTHMGGTI